jgi:hypothetical protein
MVVMIGGMMIVMVMPMIVVAMIVVAMVVVIVALMIMAVVVLAVVVRHPDLPGPRFRTRGGGTSMRAVVINYGRSKVSTVSTPIASVPIGTSWGEFVSASSGKPSRASSPSAPIGSGDRNRAAPSTKSACRNAALTIGPASTISRVMPRSASSFKIEASADCGEPEYLYPTCL